MATIGKEAKGLPLTRGEKVLLGRAGPVIGGRVYRATPAEHRVLRCVLDLIRTPGGAALLAGSGAALLYALGREVT